MTISSACTSFFLCCRCSPRYFLFFLYFLLFIIPLFALHSFSLFTLLSVPLPLSDIDIIVAIDATITAIDVLIYILVIAVLDVVINVLGVTIVAINVVIDIPDVIAVLDVVKNDIPEHGLEQASKTQQTLRPKHPTRKRRSRKTHANSNAE